MFKGARGEDRNSSFVLLLFWTTLLFQATGLKYIWHLEDFSRFCNAAFFIGASAYAAYVLVNKTYTRRIAIYFLFPGLLICFSFCFNIAYSSASNPAVLAQFGLVLPWLAYILIPSFVASRTINSWALWNSYYYFMLVMSLSGLVEYFFVTQGWVETDSVKTPFGEFSLGIVSLFYSLEGGEIYDRLYGCFLEPGTLAMYTLPVVAYSYFSRKYISAVFFSFIIMLTSSLGGYISLAALFVMFFIVRSGRRLASRFIGIGLFLLVGLMTTIVLLPRFSSSFAEKGESRLEREDSAVSFVRNLPDLLVAYPMGFPLVEATELAERNRDYAGSTFTPGNAFMLGGIAGLVGYLAVLFLSIRIALQAIAATRLSTEEAVVFSSVIVLFPFILQRSVVWDSAIFAFLFAPSIIRHLAVFERSGQPAGRSKVILRDIAGI
jgi:hypothetical protein